MENGDGKPGDTTASSSVDGCAGRRASGGSNTSSEGSFSLMRKGNWIRRFAREKRVQSIREADTLSSGSCTVEGEAELTHQLNDKRAQSFYDAQLGDDGARNGEGGVRGTWVDCGRVPYDHSKDSRHSAPFVLRLRTAPNKVTDFPIVVRQMTSASSTETTEKPPRHKLDVVSRAKNQLLTSNQSVQRRDPVLPAVSLRLCTTGKGCPAFDSVA